MNKARAEHLIKGMRYWLNRADSKLESGNASHAKIAVNKALESLSMLEAQMLRQWRKENL